MPVLDNDVDPDGEVLVVLGVSDLPDPSPITVSVLRRSVLKITAPTALTEPVELSYRISDGTQEVDGRVLVEPAPASQANRPPVVAADEYTVRAGGIVTFPVLTNDTDPDGDALEVEPPPADQPDAARDGRLFLSEDGLLRYEAPEEAVGTVRLIYSVRDTADNVASAEIVVHVLPPNPDRNQPPVPPELIGRTIAGQRVTIPIPITTMDPDGDTVTLLGIEEPPRFGTVIEVRADELVYAGRRPGGRHRRAHLQGRRPVRRRGHGQDPRSGWPASPARTTRPSPPTTRRSSGPARPYRSRSSPTTSTPTPTRCASPGRPSTARSRRRARPRSTARPSATPHPRTPDSPQTSFQYTADDGRGGQRSATVILTFQDEGDNRPPVAFDDATEPQVAGTELRLPLLINDEDPDQDELKIVEVTQDGATISADGQAVELVMPDRPVQFTYVVSDGTDTARAAVSVPLVDPDRRPAADRPARRRHRGRRGRVGQRRRPGQRRGPRRRAAAPAPGDRRASRLGHHRR